MADATGGGTLASLLTDADDAFQVGFAQSSGESVFVRRASTALTSHDGNVALDGIFDLRLFTADAELHWWWDQHECTGRWAILNDAVAADLGAQLREVASARVREPITIIGHRLLRGTVIEQSHTPDWSLIHDGHSRPLWVPLAAPRGKRVRLGVVEYVQLDTHGNAGVFGERFTTLEVQ